MGASKNKGRTKKPGDSSGPGWEIVYSGFVLILLCFFIMLSSFSSMEESKIMRFVRSFVKAVGIMPGGLKFDSGTMVLPETADIIDSSDDLAQLYSELAELRGRLAKENDMSVSYTPAGLVMRLTEHALFDVGAAGISSQAIPLLKKIGAIIARTDFDVRIEGHTDDLPIKTAQFPSNWELSTARAVKVLRYFVETGGIANRRLSAAGFGEYQPLVPNDSPEHRAQNRRVEIIFLNPDKKHTSTEGTS